MSTRIPATVIGVLSEMLAARETHATLDSLFMAAGAPGDPPDGSKHFKAQEWLRVINRDPNTDALTVLGQLVEGYMEEDLGDLDDFGKRGRAEQRERLARALYGAGLRYAKGGKLSAGVGVSPRTFRDLIRKHDVASLDAEFERALANIDKNPQDAVSAACNMLEAVCKTYIEDEKLQMPAKQDLQGVWGVVRRRLGFDPAVVEDQDLQKILSGMFSTVDGIGALRTHASSAHGAGRRRYRLEPRHARLAVHASHTIVTFVLECWERQKPVLPPEPGA